MKKPEILLATDFLAKMFVMTLLSILVSSEVLSMFGWYAHWPVRIVVMTSAYLSWNLSPIRAGIRSLGRYFYSLPKTFWALAALTFIQGFFSAPNTTDSMVYHLVRVLYWVQQRSVWQAELISSHDYMPPLGSMVMGSIYLFFGDDRFVFLTQWIPFIMTAVLAGGIAAKLHGERVFSPILLWVSVIPMVIFQAASTQVDLLLTAILLASIWFYLDFQQRASNQSLILLALSVSLGMAVKQSFLFWTIGFFGLLANFFFGMRLAQKIKMMTIAVFAMMINSRWLFQNGQLFGSALGKHISANGEIVFINEPVSFAAMVINFTRNVFMHVPLPGISRTATNLLHDFFAAFGWELNDPGFTWADSLFKFTSVVYPQEDIIVNPFHFLLIVGVGISFAIELVREKKLTTISWFYWSGWIGLLLFSLVLKWQPYHSRLQLPFFVIMTLFSVPRVLEKQWAHRMLHLSIMLSFIFIFTNVSRPFISYVPVESIIRPLMPPTARVPTSIFTTPRSEQYFHARQDLKMPYEESVRTVIDDKPANIQLEFSDGFIYPYWWLLLEGGYQGRVVPSGGERIISF